MISSSTRKLALACLSAALVLPAASHGQAVDPPLMLPLRSDSVRFAVIGDSGSGNREQNQLAQVMTDYHKRFPFTFVLMLGDNIYSGDSDSDFFWRFERPYRRLLNAGVRFYAVLGDHDTLRQLGYKPFNMEGRRYYTWPADRGSVRFFALDTKNMDGEQINWLARELPRSKEAWKICFFHHAIYSSGRNHGSDLQLRETLEPLFVKSGVNVVFSGHDHIYERIKPQRGIYYFVAGAAGMLRRGDLAATPLTAKGFDADRSFLMIEIADNTLHFQAVSRTGLTVDSGTLPRLSPATVTGASLSGWH